MDRALAAYKLGSGVARSLPGPLASAASRAASVGAAQAMRERRLMVERNLRRATGRDLRGVALRAAVQRTFDRIELRAVVRRPLTAEDEANIRRVLATAIGADFAIDIATCDAIERSASGKYEDFHSELPE